MNLAEMKRKVLTLIEEYNPNSDLLSDDPDITAKINEVTNQIMFEIARMKKIPKYVEMEVSAGDVIEFSDIEKKCGNEVYQLNIVCGVDYTPKANGTVLKINESGTAEIDVYVYPERITDQTKDKAYEFELSPECLEIMVYGVAADLLKSDVSAEYGSVYASRYESMIQRLDPRYQMSSISIHGGISL
jgi:hypothetical protein